MYDVRGSMANLSLNIDIGEVQVISRQEYEYVIMLIISVLIVVFVVNIFDHWVFIKFETKVC